MLHVFEWILTGAGLFLCGFIVTVDFLDGIKATRQWTSEWDHQIQQAPESTRKATRL